MGITTELCYALVRTRADGECGYVFGVFMNKSDAEYAQSTHLPGIPTAVIRLAARIVVTVEAP